MDNNDECHSFAMQLVNEMNNSALSDWNLQRHSFQSLTSSRLCTEDNVDECIAHLNKVFRNMCLSSWIEEEQSQMVAMVNACSELIERYQQDSRIREDLEARTRRTMSDYDQLQTAQLRLKDDIERLEREIALRQEKEKDLSSKNRNLCSAVKTEKDEVKRLQSVINHRESQYKHESKKRERETNRLKEKLNQVLMDKSQKLIGNDVINILPKTDSKRGTWKTTSKPEELYKLMLRNYEEKQKEMMQENLDLRNSLASIQQRLYSIVECYKSQLKSSGSPDSSCDDESSCFEDDLEDDEFNDKFHQVVCNGEVSGIDYLPFEMSKEDIMKNFNKACHVLIRLLKKKLNNSDEIPMNSASSVVASNSQTELEIQVSDLRKEVEEYKDIIELQDQVLRNAVESMPESQPNNSILHESQLLFEYEELESKKRLFLEEKENFDKERLLFTNAAIRLAEEKRTFNDERFQQIKQQILELTPQRGRNKTNYSPSSYTKEYGNRLLPMTPSSQHSSQHSANQKPTKSEIYKTLDLCQNHFPNRSRCSLESFTVPDSTPSSSSCSHQYVHPQSFHKSFQHSLPSTPFEDHQNNTDHLVLSSSNSSPSYRRQSAPIKSLSNALVICGTPNLRRNTNYTSLTSLDDKMYLSPDCFPRVRSQSVEEQRSSLTEP